MVPLLPPQVVGLVLLVVVTIGVSFTVTVTVAGAEVHPATDCVTE